MQLRAILFRCCGVTYFAVSFTVTNVPTVTKMPTYPLVSILLIYGFTSYSQSFRNTEGLVCASAVRQNMIRVRIVRIVFICLVFIRLIFRLTSSKKEVYHPPVPVPHPLPVLHPYSPPAPVAASIPSYSPTSPNSEHGSL